MLKQITKTPQGRLIVTGTFILGGLLVGFIIYNEIDKYKKQKLVCQKAGDLYTAAYFAHEINESFGFLSDDEQRLYGLAKNITDFTAIERAYSIIYSKDLRAEISYYLSESERNKFYSILKANNAKGI